MVESYYTTYLGRVGDPAGVASWVAKLQAGTSEETVAAAFLSSPEYTPSTSLRASSCNRSTRTSSAARAIRRGSTTGPLLGAGTSRGAVAASFIGSPESSQISIDGDYNDFLARVGDTSGVNSWVAQIQNGSMTMAEVAAMFAGSPEYASLASPTAPATHLVVTTQPPASVTANAPFGLTVTAENGSGNTDPTYTGLVTLALSGGAGGQLGGTGTGTAANGVAAFTGLTIDKVGTGYTITATSGTLTSATTLTVNKATPVITWNDPAGITYGTRIGDAVESHDAGGRQLRVLACGGTVLGVGLQQALKTTFTPTDTADYNDATASVLINVQQATPTFSGLTASQTITYGTAKSTWRAR